MSETTDNSLVPLTVRVPKEVRKKVNLIALNGDISTQQLLTELINNFVKTHGK